MIWRSITGLVGTLFLVSCSGWSSELDTAFFEDDKALEKPLCKFDLKNNCWNQSLQLLHSCAPVVEGAVELLNDDKKSCLSNEGKLIVFENDSLNKYLNYDDQPLYFRVSQGQKPCYEFYGYSDNFKIESKDYGTLEVESLSNGDIKVSCFFDQSFVIPKQAQSLGCRGQKAALPDVSASYRLDYKQEKQGSGGVVYDQFQLFLLGAGAPVQPLFRCQL